MRLGHERLYCCEAAWNGGVPLRGGEGGWPSGRADSREGLLRFLCELRFAGTAFEGVFLYYCTLRLASA
jgi:hypothetical protein